MDVHGLLVEGRENFWMCGEEWGAMGEWKEVGSEGRFFYTQ